MELRSKKTIGWLIVLGLAALPASAAEYRVRHPHWRGACDGVLRIDTAGVSFTGAKKHAWKWTWDDIEQLTLSERTVRVMTYRDRLWLLGADQQEEFVLAPDSGANTEAALLRDKLGRKFVAAAADHAAGLEIPAKLLGTLRGTAGVLVLGRDEIVFRAGVPGQSRTWPLSEIDNVLRTGPYSLELSTPERGRGEFRFQLKRPLPDTEYEALWQRLNQSKGLKILSSYKEK